MVSVIEGFHCSLLNALRKACPKMYLRTHACLHFYCKLPKVCLSVFTHYLEGVDICFEYLVHVEQHGGVVTSCIQTQLTLKLNQKLTKAHTQIIACSLQGICIREKYLCKKLGGRDLFEGGVFLGAYNITENLPAAREQEDKSLHFCSSVAVHPGCGGF